MFMALCLAVSVLAVPAAAATASELQAEAAAKKQAWDSAQGEVTKAESDLRAAEGTVKSAQDAYDAAKSKADSAESEYNSAEGLVSEKQQAIEAAADEDKASLEAELSDLQNAANAKKDALDAARSEESNAEAALNAAKTSAGIDSLESALAAAKAAADQAEQAYKDAQAAADAAAKAEADANKKPTRPTSSDLSYDSSVNFGTLEKGTTGSSLSKTFTITNRSRYDMVLNASSVSGYTVSGASGRLSAGTSAVVTVKLDSAGSTGSYNRTLNISASFLDGDGSSYPMSISIYAEVAERGYSLSISSSSRDFGKLKEGYEERDAKDTEFTVTIENKGASSVRMNGVKGNDHFTVTGVRSESETLGTNDKTDYKIVPKKGLAVGSYTDTITFQTREGATVQFKATVVVQKKVANLTVEPASLDFGSVEVGYSAVAAKQVTIKNNTDYAMHLQQPYSYSYEISTLSQTALPAGGSTTITVAPRSGMAQGTYNGTIEILSNGDHANLEVKFTVNFKTGVSSFPDVPSNSTFASDIAYVSQRGLMSGKSDGGFKPQESITRGQLVTILYRLEGQPFVSGTGFSDVAAGSYCEKATKWAAATGVTAGNADGTFKPDDPITRQQLATFLYRYSRYKGYFFLSYADLSKFSDASAVADYAKDALSWANGAGLVNGTSDGRLNPGGGATRGQSAAILHRFCVSIGK